ncbi:ATP-binding protein [Patulibacter minatonensis]|uniref:ATP-binding protein n=1 Tax=Patulibacter minatonensis TaxID=298163 RepID=UPI00047B2D46|nr:ATP-binding protein [Patulibacter minatonensis]
MSAPGDGPNGKHFLDLQGATLLRTPFWVIGRESLHQTVARQAICAITGPPGSGKTFLLDTVQPEFDRPVLRFEPEEDPTMLSITEQMLFELTGDEGGKRASKHKKVRPLIEALRTPKIVIVDEAQRMDRRCLDHLRYLYEHRESDFCLILAGGEGCWARIGAEPHLRRRVYRHTAFRYLNLDEVRTLLPKYHAVWKTEQRVIDVIDSHFAQGMAGNWASITVTATTTRKENSKPVTMAEVPALLLWHGIDWPGT